MRVSACGGKIEGRERDHVKKTERDEPSGKRKCVRVFEQARPEMKFA